ncbi:expressed unknown protein [Seminavis robusta]|uniref:Helicase-associated domain-containing protein n=1 Tax=Seminavis robusta TaxID=568900 RepID=A0A9N8DLD2_9STRA|nr:expressed unknown protein [Seminavis robusta]|eukprot:Sro206_g086480.1 n/a (409) ;mRNA; r:21708-22934
MSSPVHHLVVPPIMTTRKRNRQDIHYQAKAGDVHKYALELISFLLNENGNIAVLDEPVTATEDERQKMIRLQLRHRFYAAAATQMPAHVFAQQLLKLWGGHLQEQVIVEEEEEKPVVSTTSSGVEEDDDEEPVELPTHHRHEVPHFDDEELSLESFDDLVGGTSSGHGGGELVVTPSVVQVPDNSMGRGQRKKKRKSDSEYEEETLPIQPVRRGKELKRLLGMESKQQQQQRGKDINNMMIKEPKMPQKEPKMPRRGKELKIQPPEPPTRRGKELRMFGNHNNNNNKKPLANHSNKRQATTTKSTKYHPTKKRYKPGPKANPKATYARQKLFTWEDRMEQLTAWKDENGHLKIPTIRGRSDYNLGLWMAAQRSLYKKKTLRKERLVDLRRLGAHGFDGPNEVMPEDLV